MTGELAQIINLILQYNSNKIDIDLRNENSTYQYCNDIKFVGFKKKLFGGYTELDIAKSTIDWFKYLKQNKCKLLRLVFHTDNSQADDHKLAGFVGGGGSWFIEAVYNDFSDFWQAKWEVKANKKDGDNRIWNVTYGLTIPKAAHHIHPDYDISQQRDSLEKVLTEIAEFAGSNDNTKGWEKTFLSAKESLSEKYPQVDYHKDLIPADSLPSENAQLLIAAAKSFVFGGMGSWNDIGWFRDEKLSKQYDDLSKELYRVMNESIITSINNWAQHTI